MPTPLQQLLNLARACVVGIGPGGSRDEGGSGVWVAPGLVLTCAHVVPPTTEQVPVRWQDHRLTGRVMERQPAESSGALWRYPDVAVVRVDNAPPQHPCGWLSEVHPTGALHAFGHSNNLGDGLTPVDVKGTAGGTKTFGCGRIVQFKENEVHPGMSGGLVVDLDMASVVGIMSMSIEEAADRGGYIVPTEALRRLNSGTRRMLLAEHDRFHEHDSRWSDVRARIVRDKKTSLVSPLSPHDEVALLGLVVDSAASQSDLLGQYARYLKDVPDEAPETGRDLAYAILDRVGDSNGGNQPVVWQLLEWASELNLLDARSLELRDWITRVAAQHDLSERLTSHRQRTSAVNIASEEAVVTVEIAPKAAMPDHFRLKISEHTPSRQQVVFGPPDVYWPLEAAKVEVTEQLRQVIARLSGRVRCIEFVVPFELFDEPFDELVATKPHTNLGRRYPVVLRDLDRQRDTSTHYDWQNRWQQLQSPKPGIHWVTCDSAVQPDTFAADLETHPEDATVALTRPAGDPALGELLRVALDSGIPIAVWRRDACRNHGLTCGGECSGKVFQRAVQPLLDTKPISGLPAQIRSLRSRAASSSPSPADVTCSKIVLLWDDPTSLVALGAAIREPGTSIVSARSGGQ